MIGLAIVLLFLMFLLLGFPLAFSMGITGSIFIIIGDIPISVVAHRMVNAVNSYPILAVPMFIFAGSIMNNTGITTRIFDFARLIMGAARGGLAYVNVIASLIFSGISGAALADIGGLGKIEIQAMNEQGYKPEVSAAITGASATIGPIFPPSIPLIIYATAAEASGAKILIAGVIPGLLISIMLLLQVMYFSRKYNYPKGSKKGFDIKLIFPAFLKAFPALLTPVILIGGMLLGYFSPTEIAAITTCYGIFLGVFIYKEMSWKKFLEAARDSIRQTCNIMFIIACAGIFAFALTINQVHLQVTEFLLSLSKNPVVLLLIVNVFLLFLGMFMEVIVCILILTPLFVPALSAVGVDPIHLGIVMVMNLMVALLTPPVGMTLYLVSIVSETPVEKVMKALLPYFIPILVSLLLVTLFPPLATWLPGLFLK